MSTFYYFEPSALFLLISLLIVQKRELTYVVPVRVLLDLVPPVKRHVGNSKFFARSEGNKTTPYAIPREESVLIFLRKQFTRRTELGNDWRTSTGTSTRKRIDDKAEQISELTFKGLEKELICAKWIIEL